MRIGTVSITEAATRDSDAGYHQFHAEETQEPYGSFEVYFDAAAGWYWWACFPGCLPDGDPNGPFASSTQARRDADEWAPEFDEE